eukprot:CAMPEP_0194511414 /NCGR_PEP_ID=MMETSP0253-20130528/43079_1 /TAXON_ID=2966 /ORGANISM="Noctiluca scintillans" /LENGTH=74 /DNA_ID=CAMNT_0039354747 /DNA_START=195 /DNA_END=419 /DNA_ORIENTATION=+
MTLSPGLSSFSDCACAACAPSGAAVSRSLSLALLELDPVRSASRVSSAERTWFFLALRGAFFREDEEDELELEL